MDLHEYQAKELLAAYNVAVPKGIVASSVEEAVAAYKSLEVESVVVKAQVLTGGRGKAGGVKICKGLEELTEATKSMLGTRLVTNQTTSEGLPVNQVLIAVLTDIETELYLALLVDRTSKAITVMASTEGGVDIEAVAEKTPEKIHSVTVHGELMPFQSRQLAFELGFSAKQVSAFSSLLSKLFKGFVSSDMGMLEINPLVIDKSGDFICLDSKVNLDSNALFRHKELAALRDVTQEDEKEVAASQFDLSYIALSGEIGCMVNGAGLAMATMDMIKICGGSPANFLDVGGTATEDRVTEAFKIIDQDHNVKVVFVNIFGGIVRCDLIADGIINAIKSLGVTKPIVVRLVGNKSKEGNKKLEASGFKIIAKNDFKEAAMAAVAQIKGA